MGVGTLSSVPNTLNRWTEEAKVLDGDSIYDCMAGNYIFAIIPPGVI